VKKKLDINRQHILNEQSSLNYVISISLAARICEVCAKTLRRWETRGLICPSRTPGRHRRYSREALSEFMNTGIYQPNMVESTGIAAIYGRVSGSKQKKDLYTQTYALTQQAQADGYTPKIYTDIGSGLNDKRPRFLRLLIDAIQRRFDRVYITYRDRLARFGTHSYEEIFRSLQIPIICIREDSDCSLETKLVNDVIALITSFAGKLHRSRRGKIVIT